MTKFEPNYSNFEQETKNFYFKIDLLFIALIIGAILLCIAAYYKDNANSQNHNFGGEQLDKREYK